MDVLVALCERPNTVVSTDELLQQCWGSTLHGDNPVHKIVAQLRQVLGDNATAALYIQTIRKRGYRTVAEVLRPDPAATPLPAAWQDASPFRGLQAFQEEHATVFFGRNSANAELKLALQAQVGAGLALMLVLGPSAAGKTSLVRAGLLPGLARAEPGRDWVVVSPLTMDLGDIGEHALLDALGSVLLDWEIDGKPAFPGASAAALGQRMADAPGAVADELAQAIARELGDGGGHRCALFIDRFEAIFTLPHIDEAQRRSFLGAIEAFARSSAAVVVVGCRNDLYPRIAEYPVLMEGKARGGHFDLGRPSHAEIAQIIRLPAIAANLTFGVDAQSHARLDDILCESAFNGQDALPLLQYTLHELYRLRTPEGELSFDAFHRLGGLEGVIGQRAEEVISAMGESARAALPRVLSLVVTMSANEDIVTSRRAPWSALHGADEHAVVNTLVEARLFVSELVAGEPGFGVAHEAILRRWPRAVAWIAGHRNALRVRAGIAALAARWASEGRSSDLLLPAGRQLDEANSLLDVTTFSLSADELGLVRASAKKAARRRHMRYGTMAVVMLLAVFAGVSALIAAGANVAAQERRAEAEGLMGFMLGDLADKLRPLGRLELLDGISAKAIEYLSVSRSDEASEASLGHRAKALQTIGEVRIARGDPKGALAALSSARAITAKQLERAPRDTQVLKNAGANAFWLGQLYLDQSDWSKTEELFKAYRDFSDRVAAITPNDPDAWVEQSYAHNSLGTLELMRGNPKAAGAAFLRSIELKRRATASRPDDRVLAADLADSLTWAASAGETTGELGAAMALYQQALEQLEQLHQLAPKDALYAHRYALALQHRADLARALGRDQAALDDFAKVKDTLAQIVAAEPGNLAWQADLVAVSLRELHIRMRRDDHRTVLAAFAVILKQIDGLTAAAPDRVEWMKSKAHALQRSAVVLSAMGQRDEAMRRMDVAQALIDKVYAKNPDDVRARAMLADAALGRAGVEAADDDAKAMQRSCARALASIGKVASDSQDFRVLDPWIRASVCLGQIDKVAEAISRLDRMGYHESDYLKYLSLHR